MHYNSGAQMEHFAARKSSEILYSGCKTVFVVVVIVIDFICVY